MRKFFVPFFLLSLILTGCKNNSTGISSSLNMQNTTETNRTVEYNYEDLGEKLIYWDDVPIINLDHYYVYFFSRTCNHCQRIKNLVIPILLKRRIYYGCEASSEHQICSVTMIGKIGEIDFCILGYPTIIEIKNREVIHNVSGENEVLSFLNSK